MSTQVKAIIAGAVIVGLLALSLHFSSSRKKAEETADAGAGQGATQGTTAQGSGSSSGYGVDDKADGLGSEPSSSASSGAPQDAARNGQSTPGMTAGSARVSQGAQQNQASNSAPSADAASSDVGSAAKSGGAVAFIKSLFSRAPESKSAGTAASPGASSGPGAETAKSGEIAQGGSSTASNTIQKPAEETAGCFTVTYRHKKMMAHSSEEACSHHKNVIKLKHSKVNPKSICVRVDGKPVKFALNKKDITEVMISGIAGPEAKVTARYCLGKSGCDEDCSIPRDEFMAAIGANDDLKGTTEITYWESEGANEADTKAAAKVNSELKRELAELDEVEPGTSEGVSIFRDWVSDIEAPACGSKQAQLSPKSGE